MDVVGVLLSVVKDHVTCVLSSISEELICLNWAKDSINEDSNSFDMNQRWSVCVCLGRITVPRSPAISAYRKPERVILDLDSYYLMSS